jgi:opacity protein-like surface antigen
MGPILASGLFVSATCRARLNLMGELTARVGWSYGQFNHSLVYVKGGAAHVHDQVDIATNSATRFVTNGVAQAPLTTNSGFTKVGGLVGAGVEHAITPAWSVKLEYDFVGLGGETVATPQGLFNPFQE